MPFKTDLHQWDIKPIAGTPIWFNQVPLSYYSKRIQQQVTVPKNYKTDLASIPKKFHWFMHPASYEIRAAAVIHDFIYTDLCKSITKKQADQILYEAMGHVVSPAPKWKRYVIYLAVRIGGKGGW